jgi:hypothetical protein
VEFDAFVDEIGFFGVGAPYKPTAKIGTPRRRAHRHALRILLNQEEVGHSCANG